MNEKFHNTIKKAGEDITLSPAEHARMYRTLHAYMEMKPLRTSQSYGPRTMQSWFFTFRPVSAVLVLALFVSSAGVSYAAEDALPGDVLYVVKTQVNEPVRGALALSASAKTAWATSVAGERVQEAATLAAEGRLDAATQKQLQADFEAHAQEATHAIESQAKVTPDESAEAAVRFEAQLSEYENVLAQVGAAKHINVTDLVASVRTEGGRIATVRANSESNIASTGSKDSASVRMQAAAKRQLDDSSELAHAGSRSLSSSSASLVAAQLESASTSISDGEDFAGKNATPDALGAFRSALATSEKIGVFLKTSSAIHARTGLVVAEPKEGSTAYRGKRAEETGDSSQGDGSRPTLMAATLASPALPPTTATATVTTSGDNSATRSDTKLETQAKTEDRSDAEDEYERILPLSVPVHISQ